VVSHGEENGATDRAHLMATSHRSLAMPNLRRLLLLASVVIVPLAACGVSPTGVDDDPPPPAPGDSTGRREQNPWN
jgi:hypothetical protein